MTDEEKINELRKYLIYFIDLYWGPKWREIKRENGYQLSTFNNLNEARKLLMVTQ